MHVLPSFPPLYAYSGLFPWLWYAFSHQIGNGTWRLRLRRKAADGKPEREGHK